MNKKWSKYVYMGALAALAFALRRLEIPLLFLPPFLKLDFGDLPSLIAAFAFGPFGGAAVSTVNALLNLPFSSTMGVGDLCAYLISLPLLLCAGFIYKKHRSRGGAAWGALIGAFASALFSLFLNYYVIFPLFVKVVGLPWSVILGMYQALIPSVQNMWQALLIFNLPFTLAKYLLIFGITLLIYKPVSTLFKRWEK
ncbi:MAG: ECF transporter S component [Clostridiales bacterium]|nr:ECF transporter S component [Clostridiales bacterium]